MLGVGGLSLSFGRGGVGGGGRQGGGHLSNRMRLLERPFLKMFLHKYKMFIYTVRYVTCCLNTKIRMKKRYDLCDNTGTQCDDLLL